MTPAQQAREVIAGVDPAWLHARIAEIAVLDYIGQASEIDDLRAALIEYGMDEAVAVETAMQFEVLVRRYSETRQ